MLIDSFAHASLALLCAAALPAFGDPIRPRDARFTVLDDTTELDLEHDLGRRSSSGINFNPDGKAYLWLPTERFAGETFFDEWDFFTDDDPTEGLVRFLDRNASFANKLAYIQDDGKVVMKADNTTRIQPGEVLKRNSPCALTLGLNSVRIETKKEYDMGLFILDMDRAPWGCAVWPAFWTVGAQWPRNGEIDILEGVHDNEHNQMAWHTAPGCMLNPDTRSSFTGTIPQHPNGTWVNNCDKNYNYNSGCDIVDWSRASYGPDFEKQGGGVMAMKWDEFEIAIWSFYRAAVPRDIQEGTPNPSLWGKPSGRLDNSMCDIRRYFANHKIVFDITFCGTWAGATYTSTPCPGTCEERLLDPTNFEHAIWIINSLDVYGKLMLNATNATTRTQTGSALESAPHMNPKGLIFAAFLTLFLSLTTLML